MFRGGQAATPETIDRDRAPRTRSPPWPGLRAAAHARTCPAVPAQRQDLHVHQHAGRALRHRPAPRHDRVVVACGFSGHGFKFVPVVGEIVAELVAEDRTRQPIGLFDPGRFAVR